MIRKSITTKALLAMSDLSADLDSNQSERLAITASPRVKDTISPSFDFVIKAPFLADST